MKEKLSKASYILVFAVVFVGLITSCNHQNKNMKTTFEEFIKTLEGKIIPLYKESALASWDASISGKKEDYDKSGELQIKATNIFTSKEDFAILKKIKESGEITDEILKRELIIIYNQYLGNQVDSNKIAEKIKLGIDIENKFNNFRAEINGKKLSDNEIEEILKTSTNSEELKTAWMATKKSGTLVSNDVIKIVKLRNEIAKELGFKNYHEMSLKLSDQEPAEIDKIFNELDSLTRNSYSSLKNDIDEYLSKRFKIKKEELMPWHYQNRFFQEAPKIYKVDLDKYYATKDVVKITQEYFNGIGLNIDDMIAKSDLYEKPGKNQHAFCTDIDQEGDVRVLCNVKPNHMWMNTMLHEYGHAVYDKNIDRNLPYVLRDPAHTFTTEAIAMIFGRFASNPQWIKEMIGISDQEKQTIAEDCYKSLRLEQLVFSRWAQVMYNFEKKLYENPDQDLNKLWWDVVEQYQMMKRPEGRNEPDWATKIHIALFPCYYHNYLLGELLASQLYYYIGANVVKSNDLKNMSFVGNKEVGKYLIDKVFIPGSKYQWNEMIEKATGEKLSAKYYAKQFVN